MNRDLASSATLAQSLDPQSVGQGATVNGGEVDVTSYRWAYVVMNAGANAATTDTASFEVEVASESGGSFAAVAGTAVTVGAAGDAAFVGQIDTHQLSGNFIRVNCTGGSDGALLASASVVLTADRDTQYAGTPTATAYSI
jgi:hypothetical protein